MNAKLKVGNLVSFRNYYTSRRIGLNDNGRMDTGNNIILCQVDYANSRAKGTVILGDKLDDFVFTYDIRDLTKVKNSSDYCFFDTAIICFNKKNVATSANTVLEPYSTLRKKVLSILNEKYNYKIFNHNVRGYDGGFHIGCMKSNKIHLRFLWNQAMKINKRLKPIRKTKGIYK